MAGRRIRALQLMGRIARQALEEDAAALGALRGRIDGLEGERAAIQADLQAQAQSRSLEAVAHLPAYLRAVRGEQARIEAELGALRRQERELEAAVSRRFREGKTVELVLESARTEEREAVSRAEAAELDSFTITRHGMRAAARLRETGGA